MRRTAPPALWGAEVWGLGGFPPLMPPPEGLRAVKGKGKAAPSGKKPGKRRCHRTIVLFFGLFSTFFDNFPVSVDVVGLYLSPHLLRYPISMILPHEILGVVGRRSKGTYLPDVLLLRIPFRTFPCRDCSAGYTHSRPERRSSKANGKPYFPYHFPKFLGSLPLSFLQ